MCGGWYSDCGSRYRQGRAKRATNVREGVGGRLSLLRVWRKEQHTSGHPTFAPPLDVRPAGCADARFCFLISFACRSSSGIRPVFDEGSVRLRVTVTIEFDRDGGDSTTGDRLPPSTCGFSVTQGEGRSVASLRAAPLTAAGHSPPERSVVVRRRAIFLGTSLLISFHPPISSSELTVMSATGSAMGIVTALSDGFVVGGGGMSSMNQS